MKATLMKVRSPGVNKRGAGAILRLSCGGITESPAGISTPSPRILHAGFQSGASLSPSLINAETGHQVESTENHFPVRRTNQALERGRRGIPHLSTQFSNPWTERSYSPSTISESLFALQSSAGLTAKSESHRRPVEIPTENLRRRQYR